MQQRLAKQLLLGVGVAAVVAGVLVAYAGNTRVTVVSALPLGLILMVAGIGCMLAGLMDWSAPSGRP